MNPAYLIKLITTLWLCMSATALYAENNNAQQEQVETLFRLTNMEKKIQESVDSIVQLQISQTPQLAQHEKAIRDFFNRHIGWSALKNDITDMYMKTFTEKELEEINAFYITPAGQKVITQLPQLVQQRNQLAMMRIQQNIGELQKIIGAQQTTP